MQATVGKARAMSVRDAVAGAGVVVLTTPWAGAREAIEAAGDLAGKVLFDATNPLKLTCRATVIYPKGRDS